MQISLQGLSTLLAAHRTGGVVAAVGLLHITLSAASQRIRLLECKYGAWVLDRTPTGAVLTTIRKVPANVAECIEGELTTVRREPADLDDPIPFGVVHVGSFTSAARALLLPLLSSPATTSLELEVIAEETEERNVLPRLRRGEPDLVLMERGKHTLPAAPRGMTDISLLGESWFVAAPAEWTAPSILASLTCVTWIGLAPGTAGTFALDRPERQLGMSLMTRHVAYDYNVVLTMVSQGLGCALLPGLAAYSGLVPDEFSVMRLPRLGVRQLMVRHRPTHTEPGPATRTVLETLFSQARGIELG